jgi:hypothetical protein
MYLKLNLPLKKVATTGPAIDAETPMDRPHVRHKGKKALNERKRQIDVMQENLRILNRTAEIMSSVEIFETPGPNPHASPRCSRQRKTTAVSKRNAQLLFQWFIHKFGKYVPWWAHINY